MTICSYADCMTPQSPFSSRTFFALPTDQRRRAWIVNSGNPDLLALLHETSKRYFCDLHFRPCDIRRQFNRSTLRRDAIILAHHDAVSVGPATTVDSGIFALQYLNQNVDTNLIRLCCSESSPNHRNATPSATPHDDTFSQISAQDDLIYTDLDGSSHANSIADETEIIECVEDDEYGLIGDSLNNSATNFVDVFNTNDEPEHCVSSPTISPTRQSSLASNVFFAEVLSITESIPHRPLSDSATSSNQPNLSTPSAVIDMPYPTQRALKRRHMRMKPISSQRRPKPKPRPKRKASVINNKKQRASPAGVASNAIGLEEVAGRTEDTYFALSLVGSLERLSARKRATAKLHILQYLTELAFAED